jgi:hypothetical protein
MSSSPSSFVSVPIRTGKFLQVVDILSKHGSMYDPVEAIDLEYWLDNAEWKAEDLIPGIPLTAMDRGYAWKSLFLPHTAIEKVRRRTECVRDWLVHGRRGISSKIQDLGC